MNELVVEWYSTMSTTCIEVRITTNYKQGQAFKFVWIASDIFCYVVFFAAAASAVVQWNDGDGDKQFRRMHFLILMEPYYHYCSVTATRLYLVYAVQSSAFLILHNQLLYFIRCRIASRRRT